MNNPFIYPSGDKIWQNSQGDLHREDGPACEERIGSKFWCINGKRHREDGPASIFSNGEKCWHIEGRQLK